MALPLFLNESEFKGMREGVQPEKVQQRVKFEAWISDARERARGKTTTSTSGSAVKRGNPSNSNTVNNLVTAAPFGTVSSSSSSSSSSSASAQAPAPKRQKFDASGSFATKGDVIELEDSDRENDEDEVAQDFDF